MASKSRVFSAQVVSIGALLRGHSLIAASKLTTRLSTTTHFLDALSHDFGTLSCSLGCFPLDERHLSAAVELPFHIIQSWLRVGKR